MTGMSCIIGSSECVCGAMNGVISICIRVPCTGCAHINTVVRRRSRRRVKSLADVIRQLLKLSGGVEEVGRVKFGECGQSHGADFGGGKVWRDKSAELTVRFPFFRSRSLSRTPPTPLRVLCRESGRNPASPRPKHAGLRGFRFPLRHRICCRPSGEGVGLRIHG